MAAWQIFYIQGAIMLTGAFAADTNEGTSILVLGGLGSMFIAALILIVS